MKKILLSTVALFGIVTLNNAQTFKWANKIGGDFYANIESISSKGSDIFTTGFFKGTVDFDPGNSVNDITSQGSHDIFIQKLDENGNQLWTKTIGGTGSDLGRKVNNHHSHVIVTGTFSDTVDFDPGTGVVQKISKGDRDVFVLALDQSGDFLWVKTFGGTYNENFGSQELDNANDIVLTGSFADTMEIDVNGTPKTFVSKGSSDIFVLKMDLTTAVVSWVKTIGGSGDNAGIGVAIKSNRNILLTARFKNNLDANPDTSSSAVFNLSSYTGHNACLIELTEFGDFVNGFAFGNTSDMEPYDLEIDNNENIYLTGYFKATTDFDLKSGVTNITSNGGQDCFIVKLNSSKDLIWAKTFGGNQVDQSFELEVGANGAVYTTGRFSNTVDFDPGTGTENRTTISSAYDIFVQKLNSAGDFELVYTFGSSGSDIGKGLELDIMGNLYVSGEFLDAVDFDPSAGSTILTGASSTTNGFLLSFYDAQSVGTDEYSLTHSVIVYPNPVQNRLFIALEEDKITKANIFDLSGKLVNSIINNSKSIDVSDLNNGVYILKAVTEKGIITSRFVKQ